MPLVYSIQFYSKWTSNLKYYFIDKVKILFNHYIVEKLEKNPKIFQKPQQKHPFTTYYWNKQDMHYSLDPCVQG